MPVYRVFGTKYTNYYTIIEAADQFEAVDLANALPEIEWNSIPTGEIHIFKTKKTNISKGVNTEEETTLTPEEFQQDAY